MASIGVKFNQSSVGTDLADTLAKAFLGDPKTDMDYARLISTIKTDEVQRRNYEQDILYRKALEAEKLGDELRKQQDAAASLGAEPALVDIGERISRGSTKTGTSTEPPVVVMPSTFPARPAPTPLPMPGDARIQIPAEYPASTFPARPAPTALPMPAAVEPPIPVEYPPSTFPARPAPAPLPMPPGAIPPEMISAFPARPEGQARPMPPNVSAQLYSPEPGSLSGPPVSPPLDAPPAGSAAPAGGSLWDVFASALGIEPPPAQATLPPANVVEPVPNRGAMADRLPLPSERPLYEQPVPMDMIQAPDRSPIRIPGPLPTVEPPLAVPPQPQPQPPPAAKAPGALPTVEPPLPIEQPPPAAVPPEVAAKPALPTVETPAKIEPLAIQGTSGGKADTPATVETNAGPMSREGIASVIHAIMTGPESAESKMKAAQAFIGTLGITYNPDVGPGKDLGKTTAAYTLATGSVPSRESVLGTDEAIRKDIATEAAKPAKLEEGIVEVDKRQYQVKLDANGNKRLELIPGQPPPAEGNPFGAGDAAAQQNYMSKLVTEKPDPATWTPQERQNYAIMASIQFKADVKVTDNGKIVYVGGDVPPGLKPAGAVGAGQPATTPPATTPPTESAPTTAAPTTAAPTTTAPATAGAPRQNAHGRYVDPVTGAPNYGGYLVEGQPGAKGTTRVVNGQTITELPSDQGPEKPANEQIGKSYNFTDQSLRSADYMLKLKPDGLTPGLGQRILKEFTDGTPFETLVTTYAMNEKDREYFRHVMELVKDFSHRDSGADVTKSDLQTYKFLFDLPPEPTAKDIINLQTSIKDTLASARQTFNGTIPSEWLRGFDKKLAAFGIDLDEPIVKADTEKEAAKTTKTRRFDKDGNLVEVP